MGNSELLPDNRAAALESQRRFYQVTCGLPARVRPDLARVVFTVGSVGAVMMPAHLGTRVRAGLLVPDKEQVVPIVSHPRSKRWWFLVHPDIPRAAALLAELFRHHVSVVPVGYEVALPSPFGSEIGRREWVREPSSGFRPSGVLVVEATRACLSPLRR
ncbi:LysR substrate-binding domain-containing protein [Nocardia ninae]|uniref:Uncharacterized protein n=1 Tax=Nocardia ninae NBRC 108245 TaxID=1210091 RepID=A0A511MI03_9NOCA|nr:hypothetical protein NN4_46000 [Nocardia ninae NBRC 108245]